MTFQLAIYIFRLLILVLVVWIQLPFSLFPRLSIIVISNMLLFFVTSHHSLSLMKTSLSQTLAGNVSGQDIVMAGERH